MAMLADIKATLEASVSMDPGPQLAALLTARDQLNALIGAKLVDYHDNGALADSRYSNPASWLAHEANMSKHETSRVYATGRLASRFDAIAEAIDEGVLTADHIGCLKKCLPFNRTRTRAELFERDHKMLVDFARELPFSEFTRACAAWCLAAEACDPDTKAPEEKDLHLTFSDNLDGVVPRRRGASALTQLLAELTTA